MRRLGLVLGALALGCADVGSVPAASVDAAIDAPPGALCDPRAPACAPGQQCTATRWELDAPWPAPRCASAREGAVVGERGHACFAAAGDFDTCGDGLSCTNYGTGEGFCFARCSEPGATCGEGEACAIVDPASGFALCLERCTSDEDCGAPGWLACVLRGDVRVCDAARAAG